MSGGVTAYRGVNNANPLDSSVVTAANTSYTAGASGTATWTFNVAKAVAVWRTALKPAS